MSKEQDMNIRELVEAFRKQAASWGRTLRMFHANEADRLEKDLLAAIDRLKRKAATAKAECDAWRGTDGHDCTEEERAELIADARAATDEAWREPEDKEAKQ